MKKVTVDGGLRFNPPVPTHQRQQRPKTKNAPKAKANPVGEATSARLLDGNKPALAGVQVQ